MSTFQLPKSICKTLDAAFKIFLWGFSKDKVHNWTLKSWKSICQPKKESGLGIRLMEKMNQAMLAKIG